MKKTLMHNIQQFKIHILDFTYFLVLINISLLLGKYPTKKQPNKKIIKDKHWHKACLHPVCSAICAHKTLCLAITGILFVLTLNPFWLSPLVHSHYGLLAFREKEFWFDGHLGFKPSMAQSHMLKTSASLGQNLTVSKCVGKH